MHVSNFKIKQSQTKIAKILHIRLNTSCRIFSRKSFGFAKPQPLYAHAKEAFLLSVKPS